jgi:FeS assembly SUF system protein
MKPLSIIQPDSTASPSQEASDLKTAGMVRDEARAAALEPAVLAALESVFDPEIPVNIYELGLIYEVIVDQSSAVGVRMTLTAPGCPAAQSLPAEVEQKVKAVPGVTDARVDVVFDPPWTRDRMSDAAKLQLGLW